jgi:sulfatase modifying factor 1
MTRTLLLLLAVASLPQPCLAEVTFDWAYVGNVGNSPDPATGAGAVSYDYAISKHEVTNAQYTEFLNAVAATDNFGGVDPALYSSFMASTSMGGIVQSGGPGSYSYSTKPNMAQKPVTYVSFFDAMRFTNWLHNGQGSGGTESGVYAIGSGVSEVRAADARYWIPSGNEWYKAAYHQPAAQSGDADDYWLYPTASNTAPIKATANLVGDITNPGSNVANYAPPRSWDGAVTTVGSGGASSDSFYGAFDQGGNVSEWTEEVFDSIYRGMPGGSWSTNVIGLRADDRVSTLPEFELLSVGFRIATIPEPTALALATMLAGYALLRRRANR